MAEVTVLIVGQDNLDALRLTVESFRRHNSDVKFLLWYWDNNSTDGAQEWGRINVDRMFVKDAPLGHHHGEALDRMCQEVSTPYVLTLDNDVRTTAPFLRRLVEELRTAGAFAAGPHSRLPMGAVDHFGRILHGQKRIDPCCALFDTHQLARMTRSVSFTPYECVNLAKFYDTGSAIRHAAEGVGLRVLDVDWLWGSIHHYGAMTWAGLALDDTPVKRQYLERIERVRGDLKEQHASQLASAQVVVARYKENLDWLADCPHSYVVYDKSDENSGIEKLPNVGREAHTYAYHVAMNYDRLAEVTYFVQGNPFDHVPNLFDEFKIPTSRFRALGPNRMLTGRDGDECHTGLPNGDLYRSLTECPMPERVEFSPGACFVAHVSALKRYPKEWWFRLAAKLADPATQNWMPWSMERLWGAVLAAPFQPHRYHEIAGWFTDHVFFRELVEGAADGSHFVEVGSYHGRATKYIATEILNSGKRIRLDAVDHFRGSAGETEQFMRNEAEAAGGTFRAIFDGNMGEYLERITVVQKPTPDAALDYADDSLDFVFIDAGHSEEEVAADIAAWYPKVKPGGILSGHDFAGVWPGVEKAVRRRFKDDFTFIPPMSWKHIKKS